MRRVLHAHARGGRRAVRGRRRAQEGGQKYIYKLYRDVISLVGQLLLDGPELGGPELGAMRRRGARPHS